MSALDLRSGRLVCLLGSPGHIFGNQTPFQVSGHQLLQGRPCGQGDSRSLRVRGPQVGVRRP